MDFLTLYLVGKLTGRRLRTARLVTASLIGALAGTVMTFVTYASHFIEGLCTVALGYALSYAMAWIAFGGGRSVAALLRDSVIVWGAGALLGGIMTLIMSLGEPVFLGYGNSFGAPFAACALISIAVIRFVRTGRAKKSAVVVIQEGGNEYTVESLCDSGSFLTEPIAGMPVIVVRESCLGKLGAELRADTPTGLRLRLIPTSSIGGERLLRGFIPERVTVDGREVSAVIAADCENKDYGGFYGIIPSVLCK